MRLQDSRNQSRAIAQLPDAACVVKTFRQDVANGGVDEADRIVSQVGVRWQRIVVDIVHHPIARDFHEVWWDIVALIVLAPRDAIGRIALQRLIVGIIQFAAHNGDIAHRSRIIEKGVKLIETRYLEPLRLEPEAKIVVNLLVGAVRLLDVLFGGGAALLSRQ
jgi:hypothetical protein